MKDSNKTPYLVIGGITLAVFIFIIFFAINEGKGSSNTQSTLIYSANDSERPKIKFSSPSADLGKMKVTDEKNAEFILENTGTKPLQLFKVSTSCDCTFGQITIDGEKSPEFGMHSKNLWSGSIEPGKKATLTVVYRPSIMPVKGEVSRQVYIQTNDPENKQVTFSINAFVE